MLVNLKLSFKILNKNIEIIINKIIKTLKLELIIKIIFFTFNFSVFKLFSKY